ncbi:MAG TPA: hypothetical protein PKC43_07915 [Phycisphaerales bacterium]|nr:hypothetical protein [Phycisphaerales bacterium]HMP37363.1 hypothetical protein [Phycisphaerales bacterium]
MTVELARRFVGRASLRSRPFPLLRVAIFAATLALAAIARPAAAQGTSGQLPDPVSLQELTALLDRYVGASPAQWEQIDAIHDRYKTEFARLRDGEIQKFLDDARKLQGGGIPDRKLVEDYFRDQTRIESRIRALDSGLFDQIQGVLDETQAVAMPRVRLARERATYRSPMTMGMFGSAPVDLTELLGRMELPRAQMAGLDPELVPYEAQLTRELGKLHSSMGRMMMDMLDALVAEGFAEMDEQEMMANPEKIREMMEAMSRIMNAIGGKSREISGEIVKLNHRARRAVAQKLPPETARRFLREYVTRGYPMLGESTRHAERQLKAALRLRGIDDQQREALSQVLDSWYTEDDRLLEEFMKAADESSAGQSMFDMSPARWEAIQSEAAQRTERRQALDTAHVDRAKGIVGPDLAPRIDAVRSGQLDEAHFQPEPSAAELATAPEEPGRRRRFSGDGSLASQIDSTTTAGWVRQLGLSASERSIVEVLHGDYVTRWQAEVSPRIEEITAATTRLYGGFDGERRSDPSAVDDLYAARTRAIAAIDAVDDEFLSSIRAVFEDEDRREAIELIALERALDGVTAYGMYGGFAENHEADVNLASVLATALEDSAEFDAARAALLAHAEALVQTSRELRRTSLRHQQEMERFNVRFMTLDDGAALPQPDDSIQVDMQAASAANAAAAAARAAAAKAATESIGAAISPEAAAQFRRKYNREAFPNIFADRESASRYLDRALDLSDLDDVQRLALEKLRDEYTTAYEALSDRMIAAVGGVSMPSMGDPEGWRSWQEQRNRLDRIRFERDDLSTKTVRRLRQFLSEAQIQRVPGLAGYGANRRESSMFPMGD